MAITSASNISLAEFNEALQRYPTLISKIAQDSEFFYTTGETSLEQLDKFRYIDAPSRFSRKGEKRPFTLEDIKRLSTWKLRHGTYRPGLTKLVALNPESIIESATTEAFNLYDKDPENIEGVIKALSTMKGIGPATASLIFSVHDPDHVIFFSDECYKWLVANGQSPKYTIKEFEELYAKAKALIGRLHVTPIQVEKVAFVLVKESMPVKEKAPPKIPSGRARGRPKLPESEKRTKPSSGLPRGRPKSLKPKAAATPGKRGRPAKVDDISPGSKRKTTETTSSPNKILKT